LDLGLDYNIVFGLVKLVSFYSPSTEDVCVIIYRVSQNLCHKHFLGIPHPQISKKVPINMGLKVNRFRDIQCCVEIRELRLRLLSCPSTRDMILM